MTINHKYWNILIAVIYLFTTVQCIYIGYFDTFYSLGLYLVLAIQIVAVFLFGIVYFLTKKNINKSLIIVAIVISAIQLAWIISDQIEKYVPIYEIRLPEEYVGTVYLFYTNRELADVKVGNDGIGYIPYSEKVKWKVKKGSYETYKIPFRFNEIILIDYLLDKQIVYEVFCFDISELGKEESAYPYKSYPCIYENKFIQLVESNTIDEKSLRKIVYIKEKNNWKLDTLNSLSKQ